MAEKRHHPVRNTAAGVGAVALLAMLLGGRFGLGMGGNGGEGLLPAQDSAPEPVQAETETEEVVQEPDDGVLTITVREDGLDYEGKSVSISELEAALLSEYKEGASVELVDDHAVKASYDEVCALLQQLSIEYTEK